MTKSHNTRTTQIAADQKMIDGINAVLGKTASLTVASQVLAPADIAKIFQARIDANTAVEPAASALAAAVKSNRDERAKTSAFVLAFRRLLVAMFQASPDTLAQFGLSVPKVGKKTAKVKADAAAKGLATRHARGETAQKVQTVEAPPPKPLLG